MGVPSGTGGIGQPGEAPPGQPKPMQIPQTYATSVTIAATGNDFSIVFLRNIPVQNEDGSMNLGMAMVLPVMLVSVSPQTLKDLSLLLPGILAAHEEEFGEIVTPYTKRLEAEKTKKSD
jgi:hypothetical protein